MNKFEQKDDEYFVFHCACDTIHKTSMNTNNDNTNIKLDDAQFGNRGNAIYLAQ